MNHQYTGPLSLVGPVKGDKGLAGHTIVMIFYRFHRDHRNTSLVYEDLVIELRILPILDYVHSMSPRHIK